MDPIWKELGTQELDGYLKLLGDLDHQHCLSHQEADDMLKRMTKYPYYKIFCLVQGEELLATYSLIIFENFGHGGMKIAIVENVVVVERARHRGIGTEMMNDAMRRARTEGCYKLMLSSDLKRKGAHAFYDRLGFERHGISFRTGLIK